MVRQQRQGPAIGPRSRLSGRRAKGDTYPTEHIEKTRLRASWRKIFVFLGDLRFRGLFSHIAVITPSLPRVSHGSSPGNALLMLAARSRRIVYSYQVIFL
jgi:hypothetical protein